MPSAALVHGASASAAAAPRDQKTTPLSKSEKRLTLRSGAGVEAGCGVSRPPNTPRFLLTVAVDANVLAVVMTFTAPCGMPPAFTASTGSFKTSAGRLRIGLRVVSGRTWPIRRSGIDSSGDWIAQRRVPLPAVGGPKVADQAVDLVRPRGRRPVNRSRLKMIESSHAIRRTAFVGRWIAEKAALGAELLVFLENRAVDFVRRGDRGLRGTNRRSRRGCGEDGCVVAYAGGRRGARLWPRSPSPSQSRQPRAPCEVRGSHRRLERRFPSSGNHAGQKAAGPYKYKIAPPWKNWKAPLVCGFCPAI